MHHLAAQNTSTLATDVALQTQRDSVSMFTLAMVTAVFLPGTFVCVCRLPDVFLTCLNYRRPLSDKH